MSVLKDFRFAVDVRREDEHLVEVTTDQGLSLTVATPPEFRNGVPGEWSPEHMLVAATASCYALTLDAIARRREIPLRDVAISAAGHVTRRADGRLGFVVVELRVQLTTDTGLEADVRGAARLAEAVCIVSMALSVPVEVELEVRTGLPAAA
jgi:organic hydroperoxide reductase OsmC/OhrA